MSVRSNLFLISLFSISQIFAAIPYKPGDKVFNINGNEVTVESVEGNTFSVKYPDGRIEKEDEDKLKYYTSASAKPTKEFSVGQKLYNVLGDEQTVVGISPSGEILVEKPGTNYRNWVGTYSFNNYARADFKGTSKDGLAIGDTIYNYSGDKLIVVGISGDGAIAAESPESTSKRTQYYSQYQVKDLARAAYKGKSKEGFSVGDKVYYLDGGKAEVVGIAADGSLIIEEDNGVRLVRRRISTYDMKYLTSTTRKDATKDGYRVGDTVVMTDDQRATVVAINPEGRLTLEWEANGKISHRSIGDYQLTTYIKEREGGQKGQKAGGHIEVPATTTRKRK